jgi:hypothetical protein
VNANPHAGRCQTARNGRPDAAACAGDQTDFANNIVDAHRRFV